MVGAYELSSPWPVGKSRFRLIKKELCETLQLNELPAKEVSTLSLGVFKERLLSLFKELAWGRRWPEFFEALELPKHEARDCPSLKASPGAAQGTYHQFQSEISLSVGHPLLVPLTILLVHQDTWVPVKLPLRHALAFF